MKVEVYDDFIIEDLGVQEIWVYDIEVADNHNFVGNNILVHNSIYLCLEPFVKEKLKKNPDMSKNEIIDFCDNVANKVIQPYINELTLKLGDDLNVLEVDSMAMDREIIADSTLFIAKKRYICRVLDVEGVRLENPKKKVMGLELVRSSTPMFCRKYLKESIDILLDGDENELQQWVSEVKDKFMYSPIDDISRVTGVNKISYDFKIKDGNQKTIDGSQVYKSVMSEVYNTDSIKDVGFKLFNHSLYYDSPEGKAVCTPIAINSRAAMVHNVAIVVNGLDREYNLIAEKDKIRYCILKKPNIVNSEVFGYQNSKILDDINLTKYIDKDNMWDRFFIQALNIMIEPLKWSHTKKITIDEWC